MSTLDITDGDRRLDQAARAAWLYYVKGRRQEDIASDLGVSRQIVQRLIALALSENLIRFQLLHPLTECIELGDRLKDKFGLRHCEVVLSQSGIEEDIPAVASAAAIHLENLLSQKAPFTIGIGNGKAMRETVLRIGRMDRPQHKCVSLMGNLTRQGRASHYDVVTRLAERIGAQSYPLPMPIVTDTVADREVLQSQMAYRTLRALVEEAGIFVMGIGYMGWQAPMHVDGFITDVELAQAMEGGAVGELLGAGIDEKGRRLEGGYHDRLTSFHVRAGEGRPTLIVGSGVVRVPAIRAALTGGYANSLVTDEHTARLVLG